MPWLPHRGIADDVNVFTRIGESGAFPHSLPQMLTIRSPVVVDNESRQRTHDDVHARLRDVPGAAVPASRGRTGLGFAVPDACK